MKLKIKPKSKDERRWLKRHGSSKVIQELITKEASNPKYDNIDWLQQLMQDRNVDKNVIAWLLNKDNPIETVVTAISENYIKEQICTTLTSRVSS